MNGHVKNFKSKQKYGGKCGWKLNGSIVNREIDFALKLKSSRLVFIYKKKKKIRKKTRHMFSRANGYKNEK